MIRSLAVFALVHALAAPAPAQNPPEDPDAEARRLYREGEIHYAGGRYEEAAAAFERAYELSKRSALLFNLGNTYERAGDYDRAAEYLRKYIEGPKAKDVVSVRERIRRLEVAAERQRALEREREAERRRQAKERASPPPAVAAPPVTAEVKPAPPKRSWIPYAAIGSGVVIGLAGTVAFGVLAKGARDDAASHCNVIAGNNYCSIEADTHLGKEKGYSVAADISIGVAAASAASILIYWLVQPSEPNAVAAAPGPRVHPLATPGGVGLALTGGF